MLFKEKEKIIFVGDSITDCGRRKPEGEGAPAFWPYGNGYVGLVYAYLHSQYPKLHLRIINQGNDGYRSSDILEHLDAHLQLNPDWIVLMIGTNDVWRLFDCPEISHLHNDLETYRHNLEEIILRIRQAKINLLILSPFMIENNPQDLMRMKMSSYQQALRELCVKHKIPYLDLQKAFDQLLQSITTHELSRDRIHPNLTGHMLIMKEFIDFIESMS